CKVLSLRAIYSYELGQKYNVRASSCYPVREFKFPGLRKMTVEQKHNYYETLQLSPHAEQLVITKIYRLLAAYYHPDNKQTGNEEKFKQILKAYEVLSDPAKRSRYDLEHFGAESKHAKVRSAEDKSSQTRERLKSRLGQLE